MQAETLAGLMGLAGAVVGAAVSTGAVIWQQRKTAQETERAAEGASGHEAAEAAQAAFAEAFVKWETIEYPAAWLRKVAIRLYLRQPVSREDLTDDVPELPGGVCPLRSVELKEEEARVYAALATLPPLQRAVLAWHLDGFATSEIGDALDMTHEAVRQNLSRGRARLKTTLLSANDGGER
ncbi:RNA polymerase sigma factor [Streptomyces sp. V4I2]|uniref:RNA polymerase sigma factor n=1 Tax=Streptomyces sp. V4I2 TaxID=3042280 RepID=UPI00277E4EF0|nr:sigma-70 family RNA polymerase sigma factor [Streptomyces sp. V4I2]MDQ1042126.1 RNA polymerase sigma factor (sigma-70 family) [Streptomyces sp. V4I2]